MSETTTKSKDLLAAEVAKPAYQPPAVVALGELARGTGKCSKGSNGKASDPYCVQGTSPSA